MNVLEAQTLFRDYIDDPDQTFLTDAQVNQYITFGLEDWRNLIRQYRPDMLLQTVELTVANAANYTAQPASAKPVQAALNLNDPAILYPGKAANVPLMGPNPVVTAPGPPPVTTTYYGQIQNITNIYMGPSGISRDRSLRMVPVASGAPLNLATSLSNYMLQKYILYFNARFPEEFTIEFFPRRVTDLSTMELTEPLEGGMLEEFQELAILLGTRRYFIRDGMMNEPIERQIQINADNFARFLIGGRLRDGFDGVTVTHIF
jgi:hypothetical protein